MNANRLGSKLSKEKTRPKSTERIKSLKIKSSDVADDNVGNVDIGNCEMENETMVEQLDEYRINPKFLQSNHSPQPPKEKPRKPVIIQKLKSSSNLLQSKPKERVYVARPVTDDEELDMMVGLSQFSVDLSDQQIKPHTILGSVNDFKQQAAKERQCELLSAKSSVKSVDRKSYNQGPACLLSGKSNTARINESKALKNWENQMKDRKKQQQHLSKNLDVDKDMLVMNQSDDYRSIQEERAIIDRAMATKDYGKGYRVGSEFWRQVEGVGNDDEGISITLGKTEKGNIKPVEHVGNPSSTKKAMGTDWMETQRMANVHNHWWKSSYLDERQNYFKDVIEEMDPHKPYIEGLEVVGHGLKVPQCDEIIKEIELNDDTDEQQVVLDLEESEKIDPLEQFEDVFPTPIFGPSLLINGHTAKWEGPPINGCTENSIDIQLLFDCSVGDVATDFIDITNNGTAAIKYQWKKQCDYDPFGLKKGKQTRRFYFDVCDGIILPGVTIKIPFMFKSPNAGIFTETWRLETNIVLCAGGTIEICLHGTSTRDDEYKDQRAAIEEMYRSRQTKAMVERMIVQIIAGIKTPPRPSTPVENYITEEDIFARENNTLHYHTDTMNNLKEFYSELNPDEDWDMSINTLLKNIVNQDENQKEHGLKKLNDVIKPLNHAVDKPVDRNVYDKCYQILCETVDKFVLNSMVLSQRLGMPEKVFLVKKDVASKKAKKSAVVEMQKTNRVEPKSAKKDAPTGKKDTSTGKKGAQAKDKGKAETPPIVIVKETPIVEVEDLVPVISKDMSHPAYGKYLEKMYGQVRHCLLEMAEDLETVLSSQLN